MSLSRDAALPAPAGGRSLWHQPYLLLCAAALFWAANFVLGRATHDSLPPFALAFWRWLLAGLIILPFAWRHLKQDARALWDARWRLAVLAGVGVSAFAALVYVGLGSTTALNALLLQSVIPAAIVAGAAVQYGERPGWRQSVGLVLSTIGVVVIATHGSWQDLIALTLQRGDLFVLLAVLAYAAYSNGLRHRPAVHPLSFLTAICLLGALWLAPFLVHEMGTRGSFPLTAPALGVLAFLAVFPSLLSYMFYNRGVALIGPSRAGQFIHLIPLFGSLMAVVLLGESLRAYHLAGLLLIGSGVVLAVRR